jgi:hypothetical protein
MLEAGSGVSELDMEDVMTCRNVEHPDPGRPSTSKISPDLKIHQVDPECIHNSSG